MSLEDLKEDVKRNFLFYFMFISGFALMFTTPDPNLEDVNLNAAITRCAAAIMIVFAYATRHGTWLSRIDDRVTELEEKLEDSENERKE